MAPLQPDDTSDEYSSSVSDIEQNQNGRLESDPTVPNGYFEEQEFHTPDSENQSGDDTSEDDGEDEKNDREAALPPTAPLLPAEILKPRPSPAQSLEDIPWERLTRKQKQTLRNRSRKMKKAALEELRHESERTGVLEAGRVAQLKRGVVTSTSPSKVRSGRVEKKGKKEVVSGRQRLLEERKRLVRNGGGRDLRPSAKKAKSAKSKR